MTGRIVEEEYKIGKIGREYLIIHHTYSFHNKGGSTQGKIERVTGAECKATSEDNVNYK